MNLSLALTMSAITIHDRFARGGGADPQAAVINDVCPEAPPGIDTYVDLIFSWVKYGVGALIVVAAVLSVGAMIVGRLSNTGRMAQVGSAGLLVAILGAILYVTIYGIVVAITGSGC
ncbi:hypothetical protein RDV89_17520 [Nocardioides zeae]|uniref:Integral membrane protein n=1 Tax=Nocardioides imazamoxiresistens TaxID=3231893 RepID=A0ABU3Q053_9ACTN|nr:hypothetical protein [Nocardioides zeae]MDT9594892.1 hypothetical protein [Nocardioides zeae]